MSDKYDYARNVAPTFTFIKTPKPSSWRCHLFGSKGSGITYIPAEGDVPNRFVRWMMKVCFACTWEKQK